MAAVDYVLPQDYGVKLPDNRLCGLTDLKCGHKGRLNVASKHVSRWESIPGINFLVDELLPCASSSFVQSPDLGFGQWRRSGWRLNSHLTSQSAVTLWSGAPRDSVLSSAHYTEAKHSFDEMDEASDIVDVFDYALSRGTSIYRGSISSNISDVTSCSSLSSCSVYKPHKGNDVRLEAIKAIRSRDGVLELKHFRVLSRLGKGDTGAVYLAELIGTGTHFAIKVMDKDALECVDKLLRAQTEREILQSLDHPFLPTLYAHFETERYSYMLMEFCPGGDLHFLRQRQPEKFFTEHAARFYVAEVLLALEYLHMLGIIYRDLKPENVLVRDDGHIMLSDFNLSLRCVFCPSISRSNSISESNTSAYFVQPTCEEVACATQSPRFMPTCCSAGYSSGKSKKGNKSKQRNSDAHYQVCPLPELIAEPTSARSMSIVGTHEYLAPEIIRNEGHGSAVDWWTLGIFLYELLFGNTPFKGSGNDAAILNVVGQPLRFPESPTVSFAARDLIRGLLVKDPQHRLGYRRGATEIKQHPFFQGVNWALVRCASPPEVPRKLAAQKLSAINMTHTAGYYSDIDFF